MKGSCGQRSNQEENGEVCGLAVFYWSWRRKFLNRLDYGRLELTEIAEGSKGEAAL